MVEALAFNVSALFSCRRTYTARSRFLSRPLSTAIESSQPDMSHVWAFTYFKLKDPRKQCTCFAIRSSHKDPAIRNSNTGMTSQLELTDSSSGHKPVKSIYWLLLLNLGIFVADHILKLDACKVLYLYHGQPQWYQFLTALFCHVNWNHLSSNLFFLYTFGKLVEEEEGGWALWTSFLATGAGANLLSWLILPRSVVSLGASGAVFGLFAISVLVKMSWNWRKILEVFILGQFVLERVMEAAQSSVQMAGIANSKGFPNVNHIGHLFGALIGVALIWLIGCIPAQERHLKTH